MKTMIAAIALVIAIPAAAQTANQHQDHGQHQQQGGHAQRKQGQAGHDQHQQGQGLPQGQHREGCCADRNNNGRPDCCEQAANGQRAGCCAGHEGHGQHEADSAQD